MSYKIDQLKGGERLINLGFCGTDIVGGMFKGKPRTFVLHDGQNNLCPEILTDVFNYFKQNKVSYIK